MVYASRLRLPLGASMSVAILSAWYALVPCFCPSGHDFAIASSLPSVTAWNLRVAMRFVGNYATYGLPPQIHYIPVIRQENRKALINIALRFWEVTPVGLEPTTQWLRVICSTNWATESLHCCKCKIIINLLTMQFFIKTFSNFNLYPPLVCFYYCK